MGIENADMDKFGVNQHTGMGLKKQALSSKAQIGCLLLLLSGYVTLGCSCCSSSLLRGVLAVEVLQVGFE